MGTGRPAVAVPVLVVLTAVALAAAGCGAGPPALVGTVTDVPYCDLGGGPQTMDVYSPTPPPAGPAPVVVDLHGGGWVGGDATLSAGSLDGRVEASVVGRGWVFVSVNYRLAPAARWPAQIEDAMCAVRYLRANAAALHVDPGRIGAMGASAGGQLASLLGLAGPQAGFDVGPDLDRSGAVDAVVDEYGPSDLNAPSWAASAVARQVTPQVFGVPAGPTSAVLAGASPVTYVAPGAPPFLVVQGQDDDVVLPAQSEELVRRLRAAGDAARLVMVGGAGHGLVPVAGRQITPSLATLAEQVTTFFDRHLGG